jgi:hypothetical protein
MGENSAGVWRCILPDKSIHAGENLFVWNSTLLRLSPVRLVRQFERRCSATVEHQSKTSGSKSEQPYCWPEFLPRLFSSTVPSLLGVRMSDRAVTSVRARSPMAVALFPGQQ